jgi:hypothetical protein
MISLRLAVPVVLAAAAVAGCFTYFATRPSPVETDQRLPPTAPDMTDSGTATLTNIGQSKWEKSKQQPSSKRLRRC